LKTLGNRRSEPMMKGLDAKARRARVESSPRVKANLQRSEATRRCRGRAERGIGSSAGTLPDGVPGDRDVRIGLASEARNCNPQSDRVGDGLAALD
jgi:hypothetical protein